MNILDIIEKKKNISILSSDEFFYVVQGYMMGLITDEEMTLFLKTICNIGMSNEEIFLFTKIMLNSGEVLDLSSINGVKVDKHSTGGVGDKTTLIVTPLCASCGIIVPKISGRALGFTGGTIDKLESIEGINVNLDKDSFIKQLNEIGAAITTTSSNIVPADKKIYALRDVTGTVSSIPLIASSIMSKKLATNADKIVLDVKVGRGALINSKEEAIKLAKIMINIGKQFGKETMALITNMNYPIGNNIGNGLEVLEAIDILKGNGSKELRDLSVAIASYMVSIGKNISIDLAMNEVTEALNSGNAYKKFQEIIAYQKGNLDKICISSTIKEYKSRGKGYINAIDALKIGEFVMRIGTGRIHKEDKIDYGVGMVLHHSIGDYIEKGDILASIYINKEEDLSVLDDMFIIEKDKKELEPLIYGIIK